MKNTSVDSTLSARKRYYISYLQQALSQDFLGLDELELSHLPFLKKVERYNRHFSSCPSVLSLSFKRGLDCEAIYILYICLFHKN